MLYVKMVGGLGNQLFQYAAGRAEARRRGVPLKLDMTGYEPGSSRAPDILDFAISADVATPEELAQFYRTRGWLERKARAGFYKYVVNYYIGYHSGLLAPGRHGYMAGYFQDERYFESSRAEITSLRLKDETRVREARRCLPSNTECVSVHVRRGDFTARQNAAILDICGSDYYSLAMATMRADLGQFTPVVFSDDLDWVRSHLTFGPNAIYADELPPLTAAEQLVLMSRCDHHVIANSTFSWWAAYLSGARKVLAPDLWMRGTRAYHHIVPKRWTRLSTTSAPPYIARGHL